MATVPNKPTVVRISRGAQNNGQAVVPVERVSCPAIGTERNQPTTNCVRLSDQKQTIVPFEANKLAMKTAGQRDSPGLDMNKNSEMMFHRGSEISQYNRSSANSSRNQIVPMQSSSADQNQTFAFQQSHPVKGISSKYLSKESSPIHNRTRFGKESNKTKQKYRRRLAGFQMTRCCCLSLIGSIVALLLLGILLAVIIMMALQPRKTTSTTTTTATTSTSTTSTSSTSTTESSTTSTTATTITIADACVGIRFNQTGEIIAGDGSSGKAANQFDKPSCIYLDANDTMYICDHHNDRVQKWLSGASNGTTVAGKTAGPGATEIPHVQSLAFDRNRKMYVTGHKLTTVLAYSPNSFNGSIAAGGNSGGANQLNEPTDLYVDHDLNIYIVDSKNSRVIKWAPNATSGTPVISSNTMASVNGMLPIPNTTNQVYLSNEANKAIYLWTFGSSNPNVTLNQVNSMTSSTLGKVQRMNLDSQTNLFVADKDQHRVVMYCVNSTVGYPVVGESGTTPQLKSPMDIAFDSRGNLYVVSEENVVIRYTRLP